MRLAPLLVIAVTLGSAAPAGAEEACRAVLWAAAGARPEQVESAEARLQGCELLPLPPPAAAGSSPEREGLRATTSAELASALEGYYAADFAAASEAFSALIERRAVALAIEDSLDLLGAVLLWHGAALVKLDDADGGAERFAFALAVGVDEIDRSLFPPEVTRVFEGARAGRAARASHRVSLTTNPPGALMTLDGVALADPAPTTTEVPAGVHVFVARRPGYRPTGHLVEVHLPGEAAFELAAASPEQAAAQVSLLRRDGLLDPSETSHRSAVLSATGANRLLVVAGEGAPRLISRGGEELPWPEPEAAAETVSGGDGEPPLPPSEQAVTATAAVPTPVWRQWWFWVAIVAGVAVAGTAVGLSVHYGTENRDTFTLVPGERR